MTTKLETMLNELIENSSTAHVNHAELEPIKQEILQEALKPTAVRVITSGAIPHNARNNRKTKGKKK